MQQVSQMRVELLQIPEIIQRESPRLETKLSKVVDKIISKKVVLCWMGSSLFVWEIWAYFLRKISGLQNVTAVEASQLEDSFPSLSDDYFVIWLSQSGNTTETYDALKFAIAQWSEVWFFINNSESKISSLPSPGFSFNQEIGKEKSPVSTKYIAHQIAVFYKLAIMLWIAWKNLTDDQAKVLNDELNQLAWIIDSILLLDYSKFDTFIADLSNTVLFIGDWLFGIWAKELALKCRETIWINSIHDSSWILNHGWINSVNNRTMCISLWNIWSLRKRIEDKGSPTIEISTLPSAELRMPTINPYLDIITAIIVWQVLVDRWAKNSWINTDIKNW